MCKFKAERLIKETLTKNHCRFLCSELDDDYFNIAKNRIMNN